MENISTEIVPETKELAERYLTTLVRATPGFGKKTEGLAKYLAESPLSPGEVNGILLAVYNPIGMSTKGQGIRVKHFVGALEKKYGNDYLANVGNNYKTFLGFLGRIEDAVEMRDLINEELGNGTQNDNVTLTFADALNFMELGLTTERVLGLLSDIRGPGTRMSKQMAFYKLREGATRVIEGKEGHLESFLFGKGAL